MDCSCVGTENVDDVGEWYAYQRTRMIPDSSYDHIAV